MEFPDQELDSEEARRAGCAPDMCAYEMKQKEPPKDLIQNGNLRSCGGHVHLGSELLASDGPEPILAIYMLDLFVGVPSLHLDFDSTSLRRRIIYGQSGRYRTKDYGLEYRSLGNFWEPAISDHETFMPLSSFGTSNNHIHGRKFCKFPDNKSLFEMLSDPFIFNDWLKQNNIK
jgi:hypothetical protein